MKTVMKYKLAWEDFEKWGNENIGYPEVSATKFIFTFKGKMSFIEFFKVLPFEMQTGVYLRYLLVCCDKEEEIGELHNFLDNYNFDDFLDDRIIKIAFEIRNKQLKNG